MLTRIKETIQNFDSCFQNKLSNVPNILADWMQSEGGLDGKDILDFGCGDGTTALGLSLLTEPRSIVGVDINVEYEACVGNAKLLGLDELPPSLSFQTISPGQVSSRGEFDFIYSWSVFEHIDSNIFDDTIRLIRLSLKRHGLLFVQIAPLYYSPEGGHLYALEWRNWEHLKQTSLIYDRIYSSMDVEAANSLWSMFITLNKITSPDLKSRISRAGFELVREHHTFTQLVPPDHLLSAYSYDALVTDQVAVLFRAV